MNVGRDEEVDMRTGSILVVAAHAGILAIRLCVSLYRA